MLRIGYNILIVMLLTGCVIMDSTLTLEHTPAMDSISSKSYPVFLARVTDRRRDPGRIGIKKSGMGTESATLYLDVNLSDWFGGVLNDELRRAGLQLAGSENPQAVRLEVDLLDFFIEPETSFWSSYNVFAQVNAEITVRFPNGSSFIRRFTSQTNDTSMVPTDGSYTDVMEATMIAWITEVVPGLVHLIQTSGNLQARAGWRVGGGGR